MHDQVCNRYGTSAVAVRLCFSEQLIAIGFQPDAKQKQPKFVGMEVFIADNPLKLRICFQGEKSDSLCTVCFLHGFFQPVLLITTQLKIRFGIGLSINGIAGEIA